MAAAAASATETAENVPPSERVIAVGSTVQDTDSAITFTAKRSSLKRSPTVPRKGSVEAAGFDTSFFAQQTPLLEGHVFKDARRSIGGFSKRYFLLFDGALIYYSHQSSYQKDQKNFLRNGTVYRLDGLYLSKVEAPPFGAKHCFYLHVPHETNKRNTLLLATSNRKSKNIWMELLQKQNPLLQPSHHHHDEQHHFKRVPSYIYKIREYHLGDPRVSPTLSLHRNHPDGEEETDNEHHNDLIRRHTLSLPIHRL